MRPVMGLKQGVLRPRQSSRSVLVGGHKLHKPGLDLTTLKRIVESKAPRICVYRSLGGIGDILMTTPAVRAIKYEWPESYVVYATDFRYMNGALKDILMYNPHIDEVIPYQTNSQANYDIQIDVTSVCAAKEKPGAMLPNRIDMFADHIGVSLEATGYIPVYTVTKDESAWAQKKMQSMNKTKKQLFVGIQVKSAAKNRSWSEERMKQLILLLSQHPLLKVIVFDVAKNNASVGNKWNFSKVESFVNYGIRQVAAVINELDLLLTLDSGLMHIAGALGIPTLALFGGTDPAARINHYPNTTAICRNNLACHPCWYNSTACNGSLTCLNSITVDEVFNTIVPMAFGSEKKKIIGSELPAVEAKMPTDLCIIRDDGIGDLVSCFPSFSAFRKKHPEKKIALATLARNRDLMKLSGCFDEIIPLARKWTEVRQDGQMYDARDLFEKRKVDGIIGCYYEDLPRPITMANFLEVEPDKDYTFPRDEDSLAQAKQLLIHYGIKNNTDKIVALQLEATCETRSWDPEYLKLLPRLLHQEGYIPIALGSKKTKMFDIYPCINLTGQTTIMLFNSIIALSDAFIGVDSGGIHLAAANKIPFVVLSNAIDPKLRLGNYENYRAIYPESLECAPCWDHGCPSKKCMRMMTPEIVIKTFKELVKNPRESSIICL